MCIPHTWCHYQHWPLLSVALSAIISQDVYTLLSLLSRTLSCALASLGPVVIFLMSLHKGSSCLYQPAQSTLSRLLGIINSTKCLDIERRGLSLSPVYDRISRIQDNWSLMCWWVFQDRSWDCFVSCREVPERPGLCKHRGIFLPPDLNRGKNLLLIRRLKSTFNKNCD